MNVTKANLAAALQALDAVLPRAEFIAMDEEMTGISIRSASTQDDSTEAHYLRVKQVAETFNIIQLGVCVAYRDDESQLRTRVFNFYVFPEGEVRMQMSADSIAFNAEHGMDFNKWIREGIPYVNAAGLQKLIKQEYKDAAGWEKEEERRRRGGEPEPVQIKVTNAAVGSVATAAASGSSSPPSPSAAPHKPIELTSEDDRPYLATVQNLTAAWLASLPASAAADTLEELELPTANSCLRVAVRQWFERALETDDAMATRRGSLLLQSRCPTGEKWKTRLVVVYGSEAALKRRAEQQLAEKRDQFEARVGMRRVWERLVAARVPLVVHHGLCDIAFAWAHFHEESLPATLADFKVAFATLFPAGAFDTKFLAARQPDRFGAAGGTHLEGLFKACDASVCKLDDYSRRYVDEGAAHEAGYDAWLTAVVFAGMGASPPALRNRFPLYRHPMVLHVDVDPDTGAPCRDCALEDDCAVYRLSNFPRSWKTSDVEHWLTAHVKFASAKRKMDLTSAPEERVRDGECASPIKDCVVVPLPRLHRISDTVVYLLVPAKHEPRLHVTVSIWFATRRTPEASGLTALVFKKIASAPAGLSRSPSDLSEPIHTCRKEEAEAGVQPSPAATPRVRVASNVAVPALHPPRPPRPPTTPEVRPWDSTGTRADEYLCGTPTPPVDTPMPA